ncbi:AsnC family transcriptional regulator, partial [mine drainage metagenome]
MDERDHQIIKLLEENSRLSNTEIARMLNVSEGTIRKRIKRLLDTGIIEKFSLITRKEGQDAIILLRIDTRDSKLTIKKLNERFRDVYEFSGKADLA